MKSEFDVKELVITGHAGRQMFARRISVDEVRVVVEGGETIGDYPDDTPYPSRLLSGVVDGRAIHVVLAYDEATASGYVVTAYEPDPRLWRPNFKKRRTP